MPHSRITAHIRTIATRSPQQTDELAHALARHAWPTGADGTTAASREWLRRWTPASAAITPGCDCPTARCACFN